MSTGEVAVGKKTLGDTLGIYVHIPYCIKKCPYCDFNSYGIGRAQAGSNPPLMPEARYVAALLQELRTLAAQPQWKQRTAHSIFFGGGTPSLFSPVSIEQIINEATHLFKVTEDLEITLEANPGTLQETLALDRLKGFKLAGVNRLSLGVQSFNQEKLRFLGRLHSAEETNQAIETVRAAGFTNLNLDLMFGTESETLEGWQQDIQKALSYSPEHISAYTLMIEQGTEFHRLAAKGELPLPEEELVTEMFIATREMLESSGYSAYEVSNFSTAGRECRHNLGYWFGEDYLSIGAGAYGYWRSRESAESMTGLRYMNIPGPEDYIKRVESTGTGAHKDEKIPTSAAETEFLLLRLRLAEGLPLELYQALFGVSFLERFAKPLEKIQQDSPDGPAFTIEAGRIKLTREGSFIANEIISELLASAT